MEFADSLSTALAQLPCRAGPFAGQANIQFTHQFALAAYMASGLLRKVVGIPADDRVREWRDWQADDEQIKALEEEEKRLGLVAKIKAAEIMRGVGGGALLLITPDDLANELVPERVTEGGLLAVNVVSRWQIQGEDWVKNLADSAYGTPRMWRLGEGGERVAIHPSKVVCFRGDPLPVGATVSDEDAFWGDCRLLRVLKAIETSDNAQAWFASLVKKAKLLRFGIPDLDAMDDTQLAKRVGTIAQSENTLNATLYRTGSGPDDPGEQITDYQVAWAGIPAMMDAFDQRVAAVADIPFTRLFGRSPAGMNATGEHDTENWNKMVAAGQKLELRPCLDQIDKALMPSAGVPLDDVTWRFAPLGTPSEKEEADTFKVTMEAVEKLLNTATIPDVAASKMVQNLMREREWMPGTDQALDEIPESERYGIEAEPEPAEGGDPASAGEGGEIGSEPPRRAANDGKPAGGA